ncbi:hypothetical protein WJX73_008388 [Symbiochloris irregularis]|uniref:Peptidoglycan binding-like domain-containing protein n=1 Tax=Symbiochloris irregularis TaxID=706552 RepID=A0AAW1PSQ6_9CHLO
MLSRSFTGRPLCPSTLSCVETLQKPVACRNAAARHLRVYAGPDKQIQQIQQTVKDAVTVIQDHLAVESSDVASALATLSHTTQALASKEQAFSGSASQAASLPSHEGPPGPPPKLAKGADDIFWVSQLHTGLEAKGFNVDTEEAEEWFFGDSTEDALLTFQACSSLKENGITTMDTWKKLLGDKLPGLDHAADKVPTVQADIEEFAADDPLGPSGSEALADQAAAAGGDISPLAFSPLATDDAFPTPGSEGPAGQAGEVSPLAFSALAEEDPSGFKGNTSSGAAIAGMPAIPMEPSSAMSESSTSSSAPAASNGSPAAAHADLPYRNLQEWPALRIEDGGRDVHHLHVALQRAGYSFGSDDAQWWQFGDSTYNAVQVFQACNNLPQTGLVDDDTWVALLGPQAQPCDIDTLFSESEDDVDMLAGSGVWLLGEQRWARASGTY